jgi:DNA modification methylase
MSELTIIYRLIADLRPSPGNPRTHSKKQIKQIERSIKEFGFLNPVLIGEDDRLIVGHGRLEAADNVGMKEIPTVCVSHLSPAQIRAYLIADNKLAENAGWDIDLLTAELKELSFNLDYDVTLIGFETPELDLMFEANKEASSQADVISPVDPKRAVSRRGDLWQIGDHRVLCGDSTDPASFERLMGNDRAGMVISDAPFNVKIAGHVSGLGKVTHREFAMASGEMSQAEFTGFLGTVFQLMADYSRDGSLHYLFMDWNHMMDLMVAAKVPYSELKNLCVWNKTNGGMGSLYRSQHELIFVYKKGTAPHINNVELGKHGRNRTNIWTYAGINSFGKTRDEELAMHPTVKPVQLVADAILDASNRGDIVLDAFGGSGTALVAAEQTGRRGRTIELDPLYVDTIVRRMQQLLKTDARLVRTGESFDFLAQWRNCGLEG